MGAEGEAEGWTSDLEKELTTSRPRLAVGNATVGNTIFNLVNNCIGSGMLSLPWALSQTSLVWGLGLMLLSATLNHLTLLLLARCCQMSGTYNYKAIGALALGDRMGTFIQCVMLCYTLGVCISYVVLIGDFLPHVLLQINSIVGNRVLDIVVAAMVFLLPLALVQDLKGLSFTSALALVCILFTAGVITEHTLEAKSLGPSISTFGIGMGAFAAVPIFSVAYTLHYNVPRYFKELKNRSLKRLMFASVPAFIICTIIYACAATCGYLSFGTDTNGNVLSNYPSDDISVDIARVSLAMVIIFSYPLAFHSLRDSILVLAPDSFRRKTGSFWVYLPFTVAILAVTVFIGILVPQVQLVLSINGAVFGAAMVYIFPSLMYASLKQRRDEAGVKLTEVLLGGEGRQREPSMVILPDVPDSYQYAVRHLGTIKGFPLLLLVLYGFGVSVLGVLSDAKVL